MSVAPVSASPNRAAQFVSNHAGKATYASFWGLLTPGIVVSAGLLVSFTTKGRVNPIKFLERPHVAGKMETWMKASVGVFAASCAASMMADSAIKRAHTAKKE